MLYLNCFICLSRLLLLTPQSISLNLIIVISAISSSWSGEGRLFSLATKLQGDHRGTTGVLCHFTVAGLHKDKTLLPQPTKISKATSANVLSNCYNIFHGRRREMACEHNKKYDNTSLLFV